MKKNGKWIKTLVWHGVAHEEECKKHSYAWSGRMPCTGIYQCVHCGCPADEAPPEFPVEGELKMEGYNIVLHEISYETAFNLMLAITERKVKLHEAIKEAYQNKDEQGQIALENQVAELNSVLQSVKNGIGGK